MKKKILFVYTNFSSFVKADYEILSEHFEVKKYQFKPARGIISMAMQMSRQLLFLMMNIWQFDAVFMWFADYHSFLPILFARLTGKKAFVVNGGYDLANIPELKYGSLYKPIRRKITLFSLKNATFCIPVVENLEKKLKEISPYIKTRTIYTGYIFKEADQADFSNNREKTVLTVSITDNYQRYMIKGLDRFRELAWKLPDFKFIVIGVLGAAKEFFEPVSDNLILIEPLKQAKLYDYYSKASFYAQFSRSEGLPNALCEGMLYGCIPIGVNTGGIPTAIDDLGLVLNEWNADAVAEYVRLTHNNVNRNHLKDHIEQKFDIKFRAEKLTDLLKSNLFNNS